MVQVFTTPHGTTSFMVFSVTYTISKILSLDVQKSQSVMPTNCQFDSIHQHNQLLQVNIYIYTHATHIMTCRVAYWDTLDNSVLHLSMQGNIFCRVIKASVVCFLVRKRKIFHDHTNAKCHLCILQSTFRPLCNIGMHLITLLNILMPSYQ